ncbi:MAG: glycosyltransferase family 4 protein [Candidatus Bathyarchaeia archaeon]
MKLKIGITRREYLTNLDGVNRFLFTLSDGLRLLGHDVYIISYSFKDGDYSNLASTIKSAFNVEYPPNIHYLTLASQPESWPKIAMAWYYRGSNLIKQLNLDALIINGVVPLKTKAKKIVVNHGIETGIFPKLKGFKRLLYLQSAKYLYKYNADAIVCVSSQLREEVQNLFGVEATFIPLPIKCHLFKACSERSNLILHVGTRRRKNVEISIKALKILVETMNIKAHLVILGSRNAYIEQLLNKYAKLIPKYLTFLFDVDIGTVAKYLNRGKVLILPSIYESFSYAVLEAFASGLPVVVSTAIPEEVVKDGVNGFRISGFEPADYAKKVSILLKIYGEK